MLTDKARLAQKIIPTSTETAHDKNDASCSNVASPVLAISRPSCRSGAKLMHEEVARLSLMLRLRPGQAARELRSALISLHKPLIDLFGPQSDVRLGIRAENDPFAQGMGEDRKLAVATDAAIEITAAEGSCGHLAAAAGPMGTLLRPHIDGTLAVLTLGPAYRIIAPEPGGVFMSLAFNRNPAITQQAFQNWWLAQHASLVVPLMPGFVAYDQVHVDHDLSRRASDAAGVPYHSYDAYDNLTWASMAAFYGSIPADPLAVRRIYEDEIGQIDHSTYRGAMMDNIV